MIAGDIDANTAADATAHHAKYSDAEAIAAVSPYLYKDADAIAAVGPHSPDFSSLLV